MSDPRPLFSFRNRTVSAYAVLAVVLFVFLKWIDAGFFMAVIDLVFSFLPFILILAVSVTAYLRYRAYRKIAADLPNPVDGVRERIRIETLQTIAAVLGISFCFYLLYSPGSYLPVFIVLSDAFLRNASVETVFLVLSWGMIILLFAAFLYAVSRYFRDKDTDRISSFPAFRKKLFQASFFAVLSLFILSLVAFSDAYRPMTEYLASAMAPLLGKESSSDLSFQAAVAKSVGNLRGSLTETNDSLKSDLGRTKGELDHAIADSGLDVSGQLSDEIKTRLSASGGTIGGSLVIRSGLSVKDTSSFEDILPQDTGTYDLGDPDVRWKTLYAQHASFSGTVEGVLVPTADLDLSGFRILNIGAGSAFTEDGGLDLVGPLTTASPISPRSGGTGIDTSSDTGVPILSSGTWTVASALPASLGGTGLSNPLTQGSVAFVGASGILAQDNANLFWDDTGNRLGIGTTSPGFALDVNGSVRANTFVGGSGVTDILKLQGTSGNGTLTSPAIQMLVGNNGGTTALTVLNNGNVGIGTGSPSRALDVVGMVKIDGAATSTIYPVLQIGSVSDAVGRDMFKINIDTDNINTNLFTVKDTGNVGIGTTSPTEKLTVSGNGARIALRTTSGPTTYATYFEQNYNAANPFNIVTGAQAIFGVAPSDNTFINGYAAVRISAGGAGAYSGSNIKMSVLSSGNVGIGTTSPAQKLDIASGNIRVDNTTYAAQYGVLYKGSNRFLHNFNYGLNGNGITTDGGNLFLGENAGNFTMGNTATQTYQASYNTGIGLNVLSINTIGNSNAGLGTSALLSNTTGNGNSAIGVGALRLNSSGSFNTAIGADALRSNTTGNNNSAVGVNAFYANTTGYQNSAVGVDAGRFLADGSTGNTTGNNSLFLGYDTRANGAGQTNQIVIGASAIGLGSNTVVLGNSSIVTTALRGNVGIGTTGPSYLLHVSRSTDGDVAGFTDMNGTCTINPTSTALICSSDQALKKDIVAISSATSLSLITSLNPVSFRWKKESESSPSHTGLIAQDVQDVFPNLVSTGPDGKLAVNYLGLVPYTVSAIQGQQAEIEFLSSQFELSTGKTATTLSELQTSVDAQLHIISDTLEDSNNLLDVRITALDSRVLSAEAALVPLSMQDARLSSLESDMVLLRDEHAVLMDFYGAFHLGDVVMKDERGDVLLDGRLGIGFDTAKPGAELDVNGTMRLRKNEEAPYKCDDEHDSAIALTSLYTTCICRADAGWVSGGDGETDCVWKRSGKSGATADVSNQAPLASDVSDESLDFGSE
ncbi:MAG: hypothetical protein HGB37_02565 [Candidatus Moranbacteria bacterium]|nr:hypothetical protein [Candidatus Moranbacteria bacterium]